MNRRDSWRALLTAAGLALAASADAQVVIAAGAPTDQLVLVVGTDASSVNTVTMNVPAADVGDPSKPVIGNPTLVRFLMFYRGTARPNFQLTADSTLGLDNGAGASIDMSEIAWVPLSGPIAAGAFDGTPNQLLLSAPSAGLTSAFLRFRYKNSAVKPDGTYDGSVRFTLSVP